MSSFRELFTDNPMLIEVRRFQRRFFGAGRSSALNNTVLTLAAICYAGLLLIVFQFKGAMPPIAMVQFQTGLFCFIAPAVLHGAIAGERERRSWDFLLVAPLTKAQIVVGKFAAALAALGAGLLLFLVPILTCAIPYERTNWYQLFLAEGMSITFSLLVCAVSLFISARSRRPFSALGTTLAILFVFLTLFPMVVGLVTGGDRKSSDTMLYLHPFVAIGKASEISEGTGPSVAPINADTNFMTAPNASAFGWPHMFVYLLLTVVFLFWSEQTLRYADDEARGLKRNKNA